MTGFSKVLLKEEGLKLHIHYKSLNARFLDLKFNMPYELQAMEEKFRKKLESSFLRGTIEVSFYIEKEKLDLPLSDLKKWITDYKKQAKALGVKEDLTMDKVLRRASQSLGAKTLTEKEKAFIYDLFVEGLGRLKEQRLKEGKSLVRVLKREIGQLRKNIIQIQKFAKENAKEIKKNWDEKVKKLQIEIEPQRFESEVVLLLDKADISEEIDRFSLHLKEFLEIVKSNENLIGKKLDFFCQELAREANTIASKAKNAELTRLSVNLKSSVEKLRQQVQNIQ